MKDRIIAVFREDDCSHNEMTMAARLNESPDKVRDVLWDMAMKDRSIKMGCGVYWLKER